MDTPALHPDQVTFNLRQAHAAQLAVALSEASHDDLMLTVTIDRHGQFIIAQPRRSGPSTPRTVPADIWQQGFDAGVEYGDERTVNASDRNPYLSYCEASSVGIKCNEPAADGARLCENHQTRFAALVSGA